MSVDANIKVQVNEDDTWKTIEVNNNSYMTVSGRWLYSLILNSSLYGKGLPQGEECDFGYDYTYFSIDNLRSFLEEKLNKFFINLKNITESGTLARIENMLLKLSGEEEKEVKDYSEEDYSYMVEDEIWDIILGFKIVGYIQHLVNLYEGYSFIPDDNIRIILWFS